MSAPEKHDNAQDKNRHAESGGESETAAFNVPIIAEITSSFVHESEDMLEQFEQALISLEQSWDEDLIRQTLRSIHSFKGNCGFLGFKGLEALSHKLETVLETMLENGLTFTEAVTSSLLKMKDVLQVTLDKLNHGEQETIEQLDEHLSHLDRLIQRMESSRHNSGDSDSSTVKPEAPAPDEPAKPGEDLSGLSHEATDHYIRADLHKLDVLINLVGEMLTAEDMLTRHPAVVGLGNEEVEKAIHQLRLVSQDLRDVAMAVRMIPLKSLFQKMMRLVHDLSRKAGKQVELKLSGEETEVDKTVIEKIADPLVHIVRNAIDHGIESSQERQKQNKPEQAKLWIVGKHESGEVLIMVKDDGRGLSRKKILERAREKGLLHGDGSDLSDAQVYKFIFEPGFSTSETVTAISGRGIGLDVVKKNIEKLSGRVDVRSLPGQGTSFILHIPLTLAIIEGMLVRLGNTRYNIPLLNIQESFRCQPRQITITPDGKELARLREDIYPVIRLHEVFRKKPDHHQLEEGILIVVESERQKACLFVDEILGEQETVIKALPKYLSRSCPLSGCTLLADGEVTFILNIAALMERT